MTWRRVLALAGLVAVVAVAAMLVLRLGGVSDVRATVASAGVWAPLLFILVHGVVTISPFPRTIFSVAAGVLFGSVFGMVITTIATLLSATAAFWLVRTAGGDMVERRAPRAAVEWIRGRLERSGLLAMVSLRLIPAMPFSVMNYGSALSGVGFLPFLLGTLIGVLPGTLAVVVLGDAAIGGEPPFALLAVSIAGAVLGVAGAVVAARRPPPPLVIEP